MADAFVQVFPDSDGKKVDNTTVTTAEGEVYRQAVSLGDPATNTRAAVATAEPATDAPGLVVRLVPSEPPPRMHTPLGGSRNDGLLDATKFSLDGFYNAWNWQDIELNSDDYAGWTVRARVECRTSDVGTSVIPRIRNITDNVNAGVGAACVADDVEYGGLEQKQTIALTLGAGVKKYRLQAVPGNANTDVFVIGHLEFIAP